MRESRTKDRLAEATEVVSETESGSTPQCHIVTGNGTLTAGGMSAHMEMLADGLAEASQEVHVWQPEKTELGCRSAAVTIHRSLGRLSIADFRRTGRALRNFPTPRRLLVYWVPHAYGYKSMNLPFCIWLWVRSAWHKDRVELMVQECFIWFKKGAWRQNAAAVVHRVMTVILMHTVDHVWMALTHYEGLLRPYALGRPVSFGWLPVPSNVAVIDDPAAVARIRGQLASSGFLIGHFGTFGSHITELLEDLAPALLRGQDSSLVLLGSASEGFRERLVRQHPDLTERIHATGYMTDAALSSYLSACDVMIQPYPDGLTARRGSALAPLAHGRPIVTNATWQTESLWRETGAVVFAEATPAAFLQAVQRLQKDSGERARVGAAAQETYRRYFEPAHMVDTILKHTTVQGTAKRP
jgi:glycosyltransferase involved in cell wall biosynthesis